MEAVPGAPWEWCALVVQGGRSRSGARASCVRCCVYSYSCLTASVWLADAQAGGSPGEAQGASLLRHRREGLRPHGSCGPVGPQGVFYPPVSADGSGPAEEGRWAGCWSGRSRAEAAARPASESTGKGVSAALWAACWLCVGSLLAAAVLFPGRGLCLPLCCPSSAPVLPCLPPPRQRRCPRPATSTRARRLSTTLTTAGPPPRPRAAKLLPGLVCRACLSRRSAAPTLDSLVDTIQLLVPALPAHALSTGRGRRAGLHIPT